MKIEHFSYEKSNNEPDPPPSKGNLCHAKNITSIVILYPEDFSDSYRASNNPDESGTNRRSPEYIKQIKYVTASTDGMIKVWKDQGAWLEQEFRVSDYYIMALSFMSFSKRLVVATADRMITFYKIVNG